MKDGSRVVVVRPGFAESYAFFVRKFDVPNANLDMLFPDDKVKNSGMVKMMLIFLMKGRRVTAVTGGQGSGKTTLIMALVRFMSGTLNIRVQEKAPELHLRKIFPSRNIQSFRETETVTGQQGIDIQKKTDGNVNLIGEVAEMHMASKAIQAAEVGSDFTVFSAHPNSTPALVRYLTNSLVKEDNFSDEKAEEQVVGILDIDIHLRRRQNGFRHLDYINEIIPLTVKEDYKEQALEEAVSLAETFKAFAKIFTEYARRSTDRKTYECREIIVYENGAYVYKNKLSEKTIEEMKDHMTELESVAFDQFLSMCETLGDQDWSEVIKNNPIVLHPKPEFKRGNEAS